MTEEKPEVTVEELGALIKFFNGLKDFPVDIAVVEKETGIEFRNRFNNTTSVYYRDAFVLNMSIIPTGEKSLLTSVLIEADPDKVEIPEAPPGLKFNESNYSYLPRYQIASRLGDSHYRSLSYPDQKECREVNGTDGCINPTSWKYRIDEKRRHFISEEERAGFKEIALGLMTAIKENRFEAHLEEFKKKYPREKFDGHKFFAHTLTIVYFNDKKHGEHFGEHLEKDGLSEYIGLHFYPEEYSEWRFAKPYIFDFFGLEQIDALQAPAMRPYAGLKDTEGVPNPAPPIDENQKAQLPDVSRAGQKKGGWVHYSDVRHVGGGWNLWMPGFYPHDGKQAERFVKKDIYEFSQFEVLFSRKNDGDLQNYSSCSLCSFGMRAKNKNEQVSMSSLLESLWFVRRA